MFKAAINEEIKVPAHIDHLGDLRNFVTKAGRKHNFPPTVVNAFKLSIDEAATNIIKHAYR
ncbi:MAG TPA: ATP-binding protein, partial [bacterium]